MHLSINGTKLKVHTVKEKSSVSSSLTKIIALRQNYTEKTNHYDKEIKENLVQVFKISMLRLVKM